MEKYFTPQNFIIVLVACLLINFNASINWWIPSTIAMLTIKFVLAPLLSRPIPTFKEIGWLILMGNVVLVVIFALI